ncbi:uncharacterized protein J3R85_013106 [Psidium guajava]|nr:uncharacterized protein J3R85_013106 [Psidium guajava]
MLIWTVDSSVPSCGEEGRGKTVQGSSRGWWRISFGCITHPPLLAQSFRVPNAVAQLAGCSDSRWLLFTARGLGKFVSHPPSPNCVVLFKKLMMLPF